MSILDSIAARFRTLIPTDEPTAAEADALRLPEYPRGDEPKPLIKRGRTADHVVAVNILGLLNLGEALQRCDLADTEQAGYVSRLSTALSDELYALTEWIEERHDELWEDRLRAEQDNPVRPGATFNEPPIVPNIPNIPTITLDLAPAPKIDEPMTLDDFLTKCIKDCIR